MPLPPLPKYPPVTHTFLSIPASEVHQLVAQWRRDGFNISWVHVYRLPPRTENFYDLIVHNSSATHTKAYLDITGNELSQAMTNESRDGLSLKSINGKVRAHDSTPLYSVVFGRNPNIIETTVIWGTNFLQQYTMDIELRKASWSICSQTIISNHGHFSLNNVYLRDHRLSYNITIPPEEELPLRLSAYGLDFSSFTRLTLAQYNQSYYPQYVSTFLFRASSESRFSVVYEKRPNSAAIFFRWGRNLTEAMADIVFFQDNWVPMIVCGYQYNHKTEYFIQWERRKRR